MAAPAPSPPQLTIDSTALSPSQRLPKRRRRSLVPPPPQYEDAPSILPGELVASLLNRSTAVIFKSAGFDGATALAHERLRQLAEDYYLQMLHTIQLFAHAQRRTRPTVLDFQDMLSASHITLSSLESELHRIPSKTHTLVPPPPSPPPAPAPDLAALLGPELAGAEKDRRRYTYPHLPPFPSKHTFMATPVYTSRPTEPRLIRERATEEARLAENALRKLLAVSAEESRDLEKAQGGKAAVGEKRRARDEAWVKAFEGVGAKGKVNGVGEGDGGGETGYLEVIVNAESQFWRKAKRRRPV